MSEPEIYCPYDTNGDGNCGRYTCERCHPECQLLKTAEDVKAAYPLTVDDAVDRVRQGIESLVPVPHEGEPGEYVYSPTCPCYQCSCRHPRMPA